MLAVLPNCGFDITNQLLNQNNYWRIEKIENLKVGCNVKKSKKKTFKNLHENFQKITWFVVRNTHADLGEFWK